MDSVQDSVKALTVAGSGGAGAALQMCPLSLELDPEKTPWSTVFPLFGRLRRDASVEHMAGVSGRTLHMRGRRTVRRGTDRSTAYVFDV